MDPDAGQDPLKPHLWVQLGIWRIGLAAGAFGRAGGPTVAVETCLKSCYQP